MALDRVFLHLSDREFARGLTSVAMSRIRKLVHIAFKPGLELERLMQVNGVAALRRGTGMRQKWEDDNHRRIGLVGSFDDYCRWEECGMIVYIRIEAGCFHNCSSTIIAHKTIKRKSESNISWRKG